VYFLKLSTCILFHVATLHSDLASALISLWQSSSSNADDKGARKGGCGQPLLELDILQKL